MLGIVTTPNIFFHPLRFRAAIIKAVFTIDPIIICEFVTTMLFVANILFSNSPKNVGTSNDTKNIIIVCDISTCFENYPTLLLIIPSPIF